MPLNQCIFDAHSHIGIFGSQYLKGRDITIFEGCEVASVSDQLNHMKSKGITTAVVVPHYTPDLHYPFDVLNPLVLDAAQHDGILGGLWVNPMPDCVEQTLHVLKLLDARPHGIVALKLSPTSWQSMYSPNPDSWSGVFKSCMLQIIEAAQKYDLVLHMHTSDGRASIAKYEKFVEQFGANTKIQLVHMGANAAGVFWLVPRFGDWVRKGYQVYADTSWCIDFGPDFMVRELNKSCPQALDRILFASDHPWGRFEVEVAKVLAINCSEEIKQKILFENAAALYKK
ncbi:MAG: amidohydrolase family protein [Nanoarchaeota archaeon]